MAISITDTCAGGCLFGSLGCRVVVVAGALPPHPHKELAFLDLVHFERYAFKTAKAFGIPFFQKGDKKGGTTAK